MWVRYDLFAMMTWDLFSFLVASATGMNHIFCIHRKFLNLVSTDDTTNQA